MPKLTDTQRARANVQPKMRKPGSRRSASARRSRTVASPVGVRQGTKRALLIDLMKRKHGATISEIVDATGWQPHSVRGAISGAIKKKLGLTVTSEPVKNRGRVYRVIGRG